MRLEEVIAVEEPLTEAERAVLARLLADVERITDADVTAWFHMLQEVPARNGTDTAPFHEILEIERLVAAALHRWTPPAFESVRVLIVRHPRTYFPGFHEPLRLERAYELAMLTRSRASVRAS
ncbi:hypothetical protein HY480_02735 [Candidatus Uhrbacteria bacterium]|nr:hypothetical protein [Candidatus Uhrbacteria bacterium]